MVLQMHRVASFDQNFVFQPENTRSVLGHQQVSVRYGVRLPKYVLLRSRESITSDFKEKNPACEFKISTIIQEFPQNGRHTCPTHAYVRRLVMRINRILRKKGFSDSTLPKSCCVLATKVMCPSPVVLPTGSWSSVSWRRMKGYHHYWHHWFDPFWIKMTSSWEPIWDRAIPRNNLIVLFRKCPRESRTRIHYSAQTKLIRFGRET